MRIVVIGATGHVGGYLVPRLIAAGHEVVAISRGRSALYRDDAAWQQVQRVAADRDAEDAAGTFGRRVADLAPDVVIDMVCFTADSARQLLDALRGRDALLLMCGTIWTHGTLTQVPARESDERHPWGEYGIAKLEIERLVLAESAAGGVPGAMLHPGHISGPGWPVINPAANLDPAVWEGLASGRRVLLPGLGLETVHDVHADDVAQAFELAVARRDAAVGGSFHVVSERALTLRGFAEAVAGWFGQQADLEFVDWDRFRGSTSEQHASTSWEHVARSHAMSIDAAEQALGYAPAHTSLDATREALDALIAAGEVRVP